MLGIESKTNCSLARHEVKCSLGRVIRGIFAGQFSSFVCHGCAGLPSGFLGCPLCVMPNENGSWHEMGNMGVYQIVSRSKYRLSRIHTQDTQSIQDLCIQIVSPWMLFQPRSCPDHGSLIADVGCSSSLCSTSIAQQRLPGVFGRNLGIQNEASLGEIKQQTVFLVKK